jgi:hypothetical protein
MPTVDWVVQIVVRVVDEAGGMPADVAARACDFFYTSVVEEEPNYYTSMNFGAAIAGYAVRHAPASCIYCTVHMS